MENVEKAWIQTFTNRRFHILDPQPEEICVEDIAHALAMQCRFTGHTKFHYSVAQHAYYASMIVSPEYAFEALNHDDSEAYISDMNRPLKHYTKAGEEYLKVERNIEYAIAAKFGLPMTMSTPVKRADTLMLYAEKAQLLQPLEWGTKWGDTTEEADITIERWTPDYAEAMFLLRFAQLQPRVAL